MSLADGYLGSMLQKSIGRDTLVGSTSPEAHLPWVSRASRLFLGTHLDGTVLAPRAQRQKEEGTRRRGQTWWSKEWTLGSWNEWTELKLKGILMVST